MSFTSRAAAVAALSALTVAQTTTTPKLEANCEDVVIFMARGNDAPYHDSRTFPFVDSTCGKLRNQGISCDFIEVQYDVTYGGSYCDQLTEGATNGVAQITAFNKKCPNTQIVINGYSEGANVMGDVLAGPGGCSGTSTGIDSNSAAGKAISAALLWGNPRHTANQSYNVLDGASLEASSARTGEILANLNRYSSVLRDYCAAGDPVCAGGTNVTQHLDYFELYTDEASSWVVGKVDARINVTSSAAPSATATSAASTTLVTSVSASATVSEVETPSASATASEVETPSASATVSEVETPSATVSDVESTSAAATASDVESVSTTECASATESASASASASAVQSSAKPAYPIASGYGTAPAHGTAPAYGTAPYPVATPSGSGYSSNPNQGYNSSTPPFPVPVPYKETCVIIPKIVYRYA